MQKNSKRKKVQTNMEIGLGVNKMTKYVENVNAYLSQMKIKQNYISKKSGIDTKKLSRILTGKQDATGNDMTAIAAALGKNVEFFWNECITVPDISSLMPERIAFYAGSPTDKQKYMANLLLSFMENIDEVLSAKSRFEQSL